MAYAATSTNIPSLTMIILADCSEFGSHRAGTDDTLQDLELFDVSCYTREAPTKYVRTYVSK